MFTSVTDPQHRQMKKLSRHFLLLSIGCAVFSFVYECFSHHVYALSMILAFLYPLLGGALVCLILSHLRRLPPSWALGAWCAGIITAMLGSLMQGVLVIFGTTNRLMIAYPLLAVGLCLAGLYGYLTDSLLRG